MTFPIDSQSSYHLFSLSLPSPAHSSHFHTLYISPEVLNYLSVNLYLPNETEWVGAGHFGFIKFSTSVWFDLSLQLNMQIERMWCASDVDVFWCVLRFSNGSQYSDMIISHAQLHRFSRNVPQHNTSKVNGTEPNECTRKTNIRK